MKPTPPSKRNLLALAALMPCVMQAAQIDVVATQTVTSTPFGPNVRAITGNTTWTKDNIYILKDKVFVTNAATLTIEPGTKIYSSKNVDVFGALVITRGAKINAAGTAAEPIVFTTLDELEAETQTDSPFDPDATVSEFPTATTAGRWGGVVILGSSTVANYLGATSIGEDRIEGFQPASSNDLDDDGRADVIEYGGVNAADNSGILRYVSIRHGGYVYAPNSEINGLTLGGVGSGTTIDHIEVYANADDGIEFFGGTVNTSYIVLAFNQDDGFDIDQGYSGTNQFWFGIQDPFLSDGVTSAHDNGGEWDGVTGAIADNPNNSAPVIYNATFIGSGVTAANGNDKGNNAVYLDDRFKGKLYNSVFDDFKEDLVEATDDGKGSGLEFGHNTIGRFGGGSFTGTNASNLTYLSGAGPAGTFFDATGAPINGNSNGGVNPMLRSYSRDGGNALLAIDPRPESGSPLLTANGATLQAGAPVATTFRGAFGADNWAAGWTKFDSATYFKQKVDVIATQTVTSTPFGVNVHAITANTTWTKDKIYILTDKVFVTNAATLTIEPGTKIYSAKDGDVFGALVITRGAKINAAGTAAEPIVFTTTDELEAETLLDFDGDGFVAEAPTTTTAGRWGGVVILGSSTVANYLGVTSIGEDRIEGFQPASSNDIDDDGRADVIEYGGVNAADNSGILRYVSIRHGGYVYAPNSEINGLTLGGVGSGTTIDHIEVYANADDGIEFFGGTVNTSYIVLAFNQDDGFDIDQGYSGTNQFWFGIQDPFLSDGVTSAHDNGGEWDGVTGAIADNPNNSAPVIYNATFIGSGVTAANGNDKGNNAVYLDDRFKGKLYNSVFDDFKEDLVEATDDGKGSGLEFGHNTIGRFGGGSFTGTNASNLTYLSGAGPAGTFFDASGAPINGNSNGGVNPKFRSYSRDVDNTLLSVDPRPASGSPLLSASLQAGAPVAVGYRGAFGADNWAAGWTKMSFARILLGEVPASGGGEPPFADADNDGISDTLEGTPALQELGFSVGTNNSGLFGSIYTEAGILNLVTGNQVMIQRTGTDVTLKIPLFRSSDLSLFTPAPDLEATFPAVPAAEFYRIEIPGAE
ncbi:hypothetical protein [Luteolibacter sp. Populi]|uniref:hypothetical protein n=1 Tax=Luteolibacter sp. Populi TaxID=3230487 RepID=UPI0034662260